MSTNANAFATLGIPVAFAVDLAQAHKRFIAESAATHPDRFTDPLDQADAAEKSAAVNEAYRVIRDPELRADALLTLLGGAGRSDDKSLPPDLLMEMMEAREKLEEAQASNDQAALRELAAWANRQRDEHLQRIASLFAQVIPAGGFPVNAAIKPDPAHPRIAPVLKQIRLELNALRYFQRMVEAAPRS